jgi:hypothetical protein
VFDDVEASQKDRPLFASSSSRQQQKNILESLLTSCLSLFYAQNIFLFSSADGAANIKSEAMPYNNLMGMDYQSLQQLASLVPTSQLLNPIDRLYSMQNQYFCNENPANVHHPHHQMCE